MSAMSRDDGDLLLLHQERKSLKLILCLSVARDWFDLPITHLLHAVYYASQLRGIGDWNIVGGKQELQAGQRGQLSH